MIDSWAVKQGSSPADTWSFTYDNALQLTGAVRKDSTQTLVDSLRYGYDKSGNRISATDDGTTTNYVTNSNNQLTVEQGFGPTLFSGTLNEPASVTVDGQPATVMSDGGSAPYTFEALIDLTEGSNNVIVEAMDGNGNTATDTFTVTVGGVQKQLEYDLNGNLRFEKNAVGTVLREFVWDAENRLLTIIDGTHTSEFEYDGYSRRVRIVEKESGVEQSNNVFVWNDGQIVQKRNSAGATVSRNYFASGFSEGVNDYFYTKDHLGSIREAVASNGTTVESRYYYTPWGEVTKISGTGVESDFLYTGHYYHEESDLFLTWFRAYDPALGRWLSRDPLPNAVMLQGPNLYLYSTNNPINYWDPDGRWAWAAAGGAIGAAWLINVVEKSAVAYYEAKDRNAQKRYIENCPIPAFAERARALENPSAAQSAAETLPDLGQALSPGSSASGWPGSPITPKDKKSTATSAAKSVGKNMGGDSSGDDSKN